MTVTVNDLHITYGKHEAVKGITFTVKPGEAVGILGGNGAGKSSTLKVLGGVIPLTSGQVTVAGYDLSNARAAEEARKVVGYCPDVGGLIRTATPREHISLALALHNKTHLWKQAFELLRRYDLHRFVDSPTSGFSHGMSRRLSTVLAVISSQKLLILDEPFDGVDPTGSQITLDIIKEAQMSGVAVIISTHLQDMLTASTERMLIMNKGRIIAEGLSEDFQGEEGANRYHNLLLSNGDRITTPLKNVTELAGQDSDDIPVTL